MIATAIEGLAFGNDPMPLRGVVVRNLRMPLNQMDAVQQDIPRTLSLMPAATVGDYENIIARLRPARLEARRSGDVEGSVRPSRE